MDEQEIIHQAFSILGQRRSLLERTQDRGVAVERSTQVHEHAPLRVRETQLPLVAVAVEGDRCRCVAVVPDDHIYSELVCGRLELPVDRGELPGKFFLR